MPNTIAKMAAQVASSSVAGMPLLQEARDRLAELIGDAEIELRGVDEVAQRTGPGSDRSGPSCWRISARSAAGVSIDDHLVDGIADETEHRERDDSDGDHDADRLDRTAKSESEHVILSALFDTRGASLRSAGDPNTIGPADSRESPPGQPRDRRIRQLLFLLGGPVEQDLVVGALGQFRPCSTRPRPAIAGAAGCRP